MEIRTMIEQAEKTVCPLTFKKIRTLLIRQGLVPSSCRELSPYRYSQNGANGPRCRDAGSVALAIRKLARQVVPGEYSYPSISWCGKWPRTVSSYAAEQRGIENFWEAAQVLWEAGGFAAGL